MTLPGLVFSYAKPNSSMFRRALDFRFRMFFEPFRLEKSIVEDELDSVSIHLVAALNENILGYARVTLRSMEAQISQLGVDQSMRKKGVGRDLLNKALDRIKEAGIKKVTLDSRLNALKFYEKMGFRSVGEVFSNKKSGLLQIRMEKVLD